VTRDQRIRRVALLCCHFTRNLAYFRAGWDILKPRDEGQFWITVTGNFIDVCALEWAKLFGDHDGKHHWKQIVDDGDSFKKSLMTRVGIRQEQWDACWKEIKEYRDKFIAHLDSELTMNVPKMDIPQRMVAFYFDQLSEHCSHSTVMNGLPSDMCEYYRRHHAEAAEVFAYNKAR
jgi:hypothetical protein